MLVTTWNVNGLRSALQKGLGTWLEQQQPDLLLMQEVRAFPHPEVFRELGYHTFWHPAERPGYSGVAIASKIEPQHAHVGCQHLDFDVEGRVLTLDFPKLRVMSLYIPSGSSGDPRQEFKYRFLDHLHGHTAGLLESLEGRELLIGGDFNIAHHPVDLKNWKANQKNSGFLPAERAWLSRYLELGLVDVHRKLLGEGAEYTWWSNRGQAFMKDVGWRLDYQLATPGLSETVEFHNTDRSERRSDHAALSIKYHFSLT